jgi:hypothetical protein
MAIGGSGDFARNAYRSIFMTRIMVTRHRASVSDQPSAVGVTFLQPLSAFLRVVLF